VVKRALNVAALVMVSPVGLVCAIEHAISPRTQWCFSFWTHVFALFPGVPGVFLRRAFYRWTLERCAEDATVEFGALFARRSAILESGAYIGPYALVGWSDPYESN
jgi:virginiamycin A acetyltransferase